MITVFYDGNCGACRREIHHYKKIAHASDFNWVNIAADGEAAALMQRHDIRLSAALYQLHCLDDDGVLHRGVAAFQLIWRRLPRWRWLATLTAIPGCQQATEFFYRRFIEYRRRAGRCALTSDP